MGAGGKKGGSKYRVTDYYMSIHFGICMGPVDAIIGVWIKERDAFPGTTTYDDDDETESNTTNEFVIDFKDFITTLNADGIVATSGSKVITDKTQIAINKSSLFGGDKKEGGVQGFMDFLPGKPDQVLPEYLASKFGLTSATCPGFRGVSSVFFHGGDRGFMWTQNNPYFPGTWITAFRASRGILQENLAVIRDGNNPPDLNPSHMIVECLTNRVWGMGASTSQLDIASFESAAQVLFDERFGLSMTWVQQATIQDFVNDILDHIQGYLFVSPRTGLMTIKLMRLDYDIDNLPVLNPDNSRITSPERVAWSETKNEIVISWTNPTSTKEETLSFQDLANVAMQGGVVSETRNYHGIRNPDLATMVGIRDIRSASAPLFQCDTEVDRSSYFIEPGMVFKINSPEDGIESIVCRATKCDYGKPGDLTIKVKFIEDIFSLEQAEFVAPPVTGWVEPGAIPQTMAHHQFATAPLPLLIANGLTSTTVDDNYPRTIPLIFAQQNGSDSNSFRVWSDVVNPTGGTERKVIGSRNETPRSETVAILPFAFESVVNHTTLGFIDGWYEYKIGSVLMIGADSSTAEIMMVKAFNNATGNMTLSRGLYDTVPREWPVGSPVWYVEDNFNAADTREIAAGEVVTYQLQTQTTRGVLPIGNAPELTYTPDDRPYRPFRPANVAVNGTTSGLITFDETVGFPATISITWANRNRFSEDQVAPTWTAANMTPETDQFTRIRVLTDDGTLVSESADLTGTSHNLPFTSLGTEGFLNVHVISVRDGFESYQNIVRRIHVVRTGYGNNYGGSYGQ